MPARLHNRPRCPKFNNRTRHEVPDNAGVYSELACFGPGGGLRVSLTWIMDPASCRSAFHGRHELNYDNGQRMEALELTIKRPILADE